MNTIELVKDYFLKEHINLYYKHLLLDLIYIFIDIS